MTDDLHKQDESHWQRLAEELGLPADEFAPVGLRDTTSVTPAPQEISTPASQIHEELAEHAALGGEPWHDDQERHRVDVMDSSESVPEAPVERAAPRGERDDEGRGRRRGRRRGRGRGDRRPEEPAAGGQETAGQEAGNDRESPSGGDEDEGQRKRRRRRRRRRSDEAPVHARPADEGEPTLAETDDEPSEDDVVDEDVEHIRPAAAQEDDEPEEDFSDWNVPSWNDLIASLYRPDR